MLRAFLLSLLIVSTAAPLCSQTAAATAARVRAVCQDALDALRAKSDFPGATLALILPDGTEVAVASGVRSTVTSEKMRPGDRMMSGSVGKTWVAASAFHLVAQGKLALEDRVAKHLGDRPWYDRLQNRSEITVHDLLRHTTGIPRYVFKREFWSACLAEPDRVWKPSELIAFVLDDEPLFEAGKGWAYADTNYILLGMILEKVSGVSFYDYAREHLLEPNGLKDTFPSDRRRLPGLVQGHCGMTKMLGLPEHVLADGEFVINPQFEWCGGGFYGTTRDLAKWARVLWTGTAFEADYLEALLETVPAERQFGPDAAYGSAVIVRKTKLGRSIGHDGVFPGYSTTMAWFPDLRIAAALQLNKDGQRETRVAPHEELVQILDAVYRSDEVRVLHDRLLTIDTHKDISPLLAKDAPKDPAQRAPFRRRYDPRVRGSSQVDFPKMREGGLDCAFFIVYVGQGPLTENGFFRAKKTALDKFDAIHRMATRFPSDIELALTADDVERIAAAGKLVACIGIENGYPMGTDLSLVEEFWKRGARYMGLTHNRHSQLGDSHTPAKPLHGGLTDLGRRAIEEMNRVGIMVDVSHASKQTMLDAVAHSKAPVMASHSAIHALYAHGRNLDDEQLLALARNGGVIQIVAFASYLKDYSVRRARISALRKELGLPGRRRRPTGDAAGEGLDAKRKAFRERMAAIDEEFPPTNVGDLCDHIDYAVRKIGIEHVAISSDFDGGGGIEGWNDASETHNVTRELVKRGYTEAQLEKLWSQNTLRVWRAVEDYAKSRR